MCRSARITGIVYAFWCLAIIIWAFLGNGETQAAAHIYLIFTGLPLAIYTLFLPHASMLAIVTAASVGWVQWVAVAEGFHRWDEWRARKR